MKKIVALMLAVTLTLGLTACGARTNNETTKDETIKNETVKEDTVKDETEGKTAVDILNDVCTLALIGTKSYGVIIRIVL